MEHLPFPIINPNDLQLPTNPSSGGELGRGAESVVEVGRYKGREVAVKRGAPSQRYLREAWLVERLVKGGEEGEGEGEGGEGGRWVVGVVGLVQLEPSSSSSSSSSPSPSSSPSSSSSSSSSSCPSSLPPSLLGNQLVLVAEMMEEGCLFDFLENGRRKITQKLALSLSICLAKAVRFLHEQELVHRDLTSLNILVDENFQIKISDFGRAFFLSEKEEKGEEGGKEEKGRKEREEEEGRKTDATGGAPVYQPPEVFYGRKFGRKGDAYALSVILWELANTALSGKYETPFSEYPNLEFDFQILIQAGKYDLRPSLPPSLPPLWKRVIEGGWEREVGGRLGSGEVVKLLEQIKL